MDNTNILDELNQQQCSVCKSDKNILLTACPGSGKTRTIIHRLAYIQDKFQDSQMYNIAITYTNRAADEIFTRIENMGIDTSSIWTGTIHQFCMNFIIRPYAMYSSRLNKGYHIIDEYTQKKYCYEIADALGIRLKYNEKPFIHENLKIEYEKRLLKNREIDFDMILELSLDLLKNNVFIAENISRVTRSIHVDEYQDTNELQYLILAEIVKANKNINIVFVGDVNQAIFGNLGGVAKSKKELEYLFQVPFENMYLSGCYRSTQNIVNYYINFETEKTSIESVSKYRDEVGVISYNNSIDKNELVYEISRIIQEQLKIGVPAEEICVVAPQWGRIFDISNKLRKLLPNVNFDAPDISPFKYDPMNPFYIIAHLLFTKSGKHVTLRKKISNEFIDILKNEYKIFVPEDYDYYNLLSVINRVDTTCNNGIDIYKVAVNNVFSSINVKLQDYNELYQVYELFLDKTKERIKNYKLSTDFEDICSFFVEKHGVVINTIHGVKGEEYTTVIGFCLLNGIIPHWDYIYKEELKPLRHNETNKLLYVLMSRAKKNLYLFSETGRKTSNGNFLSQTDELRCLS